jgi:hypothetical protein
MIPVSVIDLNAGREIDDVEMILAINRNRPRFNEIARLDAALAPHFFRRCGGTTAAGEEQCDQKKTTACKTDCAHGSTP